VAHGDHTPTLRSGLELSQGDHTPTLRYNPLVLVLLGLRIVHRYCPT